MDIILISRTRGRSWRLRLDRRTLIAWAGCAGMGVVGLAAVTLLGFWTHSSMVAAGAVPPTVLADWQAQASRERVELTQARDQASQESRALSRKIAELEAQMIRLNAAGQRMAQIANIQSGEFDFSKPVPMGGPESGGPADRPGAMGDVMGQLDRMQLQLDARERQMRVLEDMLVVGRLQKEAKPSGWPIGVGYITSGYGARTDPFTGERDFHPGVDFAAQEGSPVLAVAAGVVTDVGERTGYGNLVEINHGNGYVTRYGHNAKFLVHAGDRVTKGQPIALMGSTGRSTGPHVHFEVLLNGRTVNPARYVEAER